MLPQLVERKTLLIAVVITLQVTLSIFGGVLMTYLPDENTINQGVLVNNVDVGGLTTEAAFSRLQKKLQGKYKHTNIKVRLEDKEWVWFIPFSLAKYNLDEAVVQAYQVGRKKNLLLRAFANFESSRRKHIITIEPTFDRDQLRYKVAKIAEEVSKPSRDAQISLVGARFEIKPEQPGVTMDVEENLILLEQEILKGGVESVTLVKKVVKPQVVVNDLKDIKDSIAIFATNFNLQQINRVNIIKLAAEEINGVVVKPGQTFSFNDKVGSRIQQFGNKEAPVISNNKFIGGIDGGVSQVSTTLYNAVIRSGLKIVERSPYSKPPGYVPMGQDAAVDDMVLDFKFVNTRKSSILIITEVRRDRLLVRLFGKREEPEPGISIISEDIKTLEPQVIIKNDSSLPSGVNQVQTPGEKGYMVKVYRLWSHNGKVAQKELLSQDIYKPSPTIIKVGISPRKPGE